MTSFDTIYEAFLSKVEEDDWGSWAEEDAQADWHSIMESALAYFKFPRIDLSYTSEGFTNDLTQQEIQVIATYMKQEWLARTVNSWENIKMRYDERDFSQANYLDKLNTALENERLNAQKIENYYYRSVGGKTFDWSRLAGGN